MLTRTQSPATNTRLMVILCIAAIALTYWQHRAHNAGQQSFPERLAKRIVWPLQAAATSTFAWTHDVCVSLTHARSLVEENRKLKEEISRLEADKVTLNEYFLENKDLKQKLGLVVSGEVKGVAARVISHATSPGGPILTIQSLDGRDLEVGNTVRTQRGLLGRIISAQKSIGEVMLVTHADHAVAGVVQRSRDQAMVHPISPIRSGQPLLEVARLRGQADIQVGDLILTSSLSDVYPPNIPIGTVIRVQTAPASSRTFRALIKPAADLRNITYVLVLRSAK